MHKNEHEWRIQVAHVLDSRIQQYESACKGLATPRNAEEAKEYLWRSLEFEIPSSIQVVLMALRWCLDRDPDEVDRSFVFDLALIDILDVSETWEWVTPDQGESASLAAGDGEALRQTKMRHYSAWPIEDCLAVFQWLKLAETWPFVRSRYEDRLTSAIEYWETRKEGSV